MIPIVTYILIIISVLSIAALGGFIAEKAGIINFAIEGYMILGALSYVFISQRVVLDPGGESKINQIWIVLIAGGIAAFGSLLHAIASIRFRADQVISSIAFNLLALGIAMFFINTSLNLNGGSTANQGYEGPLSLGEHNSEWEYIFTLPVFFAIIFIILVIVFYKYSRIGYNIRSVGNNPIAAASVGIAVNRNRVYAIIISGYIGGCSGALFASYSLYFHGDVQGLGFLAVSIWILGQWKPTWIIFAASLFGLSFGIAQNMTILPGSENFSWYPPSGMLSMLPFLFSIVTLIVLSFVNKRSFVPKAIGVPYPSSNSSS